MKEERWHRPGLVGPIILIFIGVAFLLTNLGVLHLSWWWLLRLWPLLLILAGLDILARRSRVGTALVAVLALVLVGGVFYVLATNPEPGAPSWAQASLRIQQEARALQGARQADVLLRMGVGDLRLSALEDSASLFEGDLSYPERWGNPPKVSYDVSAGTGRLTLESNSKSTWVFPVFGTQSGEKWDVRLNRGVPLSLEVTSGVNSAWLDLSQLQVTHLRIKGGVGKLEVQFPFEAAQVIDARIDGGIGEVLVTIPQGLEARITTQGGLGAVDIDGQRFGKRDNVYETAGYVRSAGRLDLNIQGGIGSVRVR